MSTQPGGELIPFPRREPVEHVPAAPTAPDEVEELSPDEQVPAILVDQPATPDDVLIGKVIASATAERRPIIPGWLRNRRDFDAAVRRAAINDAHRVAFHGVRFPLYVTRTLLRSPRGAWRSTAWAYRLVSDNEAAPLRHEAVKRGDGEMYVKLRRQRDDVVRWRGTVLGCTLAALLVAAVLLRIYAPPEAMVGVIVAIVVVLGRIGSTPDRPLYERAVVSSGAPKLTSNAVVDALGALGIPALNQALAKSPGTAVTFPAPIQRDGPGYRAEVDLPLGVIAGDVMDKRERLAGGLRRPVGCVWPEGRPEFHPGRLVVWVGDVDVAKAKQPPWPLLRAGGVDLFRPFPAGTDQRGRSVPIELMFTNVLIGSIPRYGKTMWLRLLLLAAALDPRAELWTYELKGSGDLEALAKVSHRYASGGDDDVIEEVLLSLRELRDECRRRAAVISSLPRDSRPENKVTPQLANRRGLHPLVVSIDECQELFSHKQYGTEAGELAEKIIRLGPAFGVILVLATQRPDKNSLPTGVSANVGTRVCLRVMSHVENDMILGSGRYAQGVRATMFGQADKGVAYLHDGTEPRIVRSFYVDAVQADRVAGRARALREKAGTLDGYALTEQNPEHEQAVDLIADLYAVIEPGEDAVHGELLCERLGELRPLYEGWTPDALTRALKALGVTTRQIGRRVNGQTINRRGVFLADLDEARRARQLTAADSSSPASASSPASSENAP